jgi:enoyl-CoA hydratase/carnithine racemase
VRFGTSEIYQVVLADADVADALTVDVTRPDGSSWLPLFVVMHDGVELDDAARGRIRAQLLRDCSPRHLPDEIIAVPEIPRTLSGKPLEVPVKRILMGADADDVVDRSALTNPASLDPFLKLAEAGFGGTPALRTTAPVRTLHGLVVDAPADRVLRLTIDRPDRRNALDLALLDELAGRIEATDARCVIVRGAGDVFSSGYDLSGLDGDRHGDWRTRAQSLVANPHHVLFDALERSDATIIAELNGAAIGGGLELAICCDLRFAAATATVAMPAGQLGLTYSHTGLRRFTETIGLAATKELFLLGRRVDADRATRLGIVTEVHSAASLERETLAAAVEIAALCPTAQSSNKRILEGLRGAGRVLPPEVEAELQALRRACFTDEHLGEGISAFAQRREPNWTGS